MFITLETDYAVRMVYYLAKEGCRKGAGDIAEGTEVTLRFTLKILRKLVSGNIVKSYKGVNGGYELTKNPSDITLKDVVEIIEGPIILSRCLGKDYTCNRYEHSQCYFNHKFEDISKIIADELSKITFADAL
jgi:Rrf2 family protein